MKLPPDLLRRSPEEAARRIALYRLSEAVEASERLGAAEDLEALHDFRVAVRRLRSTLRAWRSLLDKSVGKKHRRRLRAIQLATGAGRDAEVALEWLEAERAELAPSQRRGHDWLTRRLRDRHLDAMAHAREAVRDDFERVEEELRERLEHMTLEVHLLEPASGPLFGEVMAVMAREGVRDLARDLGQVTSAADRELCHKARIECKRLRYLVEPLRPLLDEADRVVELCKSLQDLLGNLNDAHLLHNEIAAALEDASVEHARRLLALAGEEDPQRLRRETRRAERPGLLELARRVKLRIRRDFEHVEKDWLRDGLDKLVEDVGSLASKIETGGARDVEIERKYLLRGLPELPEGAEIVEVEQGWLPGKRLRERVRRTRQADRVAYYRTVKLGKGVSRLEIEEPTSREVFESLWALTRSCRVRKRRYLVREESLLWEIDEFHDRPLVLAEVELHSEVAQPELPAWLAPCVVREVTDDARYTNLKLARSPGSVPEEG